MKKIIISTILMIASLSQAQVIISDQPSPEPTNSSVLLEFGNNENKGIILPSVSEVTNPAAGTFAVNTTEKAVQYFDGTDWVNLTYADNLVENPFVNGGTADVGEGVVIGADTSTKPGVLVLESTDKALVLPKVADPHLNVLSPVAGTIVYDTTSDALAVYDGKEWSYWAAGIDASGILNGVTLAQNRRHWIASVYDTDYLPYTAPDAPASTDVVNADNTPEPKIVDVQGSITTTGITVQIPVASVVGSGNIGAWTATVVVPANLTEDGNSRTLELSWTEQSYTADTKYITATIKSIGGDLLAKKLDINAGIGNDYLGLLLGAFQYPYNDDGDLTSYEVRDIPGIPDRKFGLLDNTPSAGERHNFLYLPVQSASGKVWLNNNLGANYANIDNPNFNIAQQATASNDYHAYGSLFQWGRNSDGHELINWTSPTSGNPVSGYVQGPIGSYTPGYSNFVRPQGIPRNWLTTNIDFLWQGESGVNNPCPHGFRVATQSEWFTEASVNNITAAGPDTSSPLNLSLPGHHVAVTIQDLNKIYNAGVSTHYWTSSTNSTGYSYTIPVTSGSIILSNSNTRSVGYPVRCIQD